jgi:type I restriction enzyme S subunit
MIPRAPYAEQKDVVSRLDTLTTETKDLESIYQRKLSELEALKTGFAARIFRC